jgi:hypothetical protein
MQECKNAKMQECKNAKMQKCNSFLRAGVFPAMMAF